MTPGEHCGRSNTAKHVPPPGFTAAAQGNGTDAQARRIQFPLLSTVSGCLSGARCVSSSISTRLLSTHPRAVCLQVAFFPSKTKVFGESGVSTSFLAKLKVSEEKTMPGRGTALLEQGRGRAGKGHVTEERVSENRRMFTLEERAKNAKKHSLPQTLKKPVKQSLLLLSNTELGVEDGEGVMANTIV